MKHKRCNKKGQWGPDALIGVVLLALISMGGIFALNIFVEGISYDNLIRIMDSELDETCLFTMMPMIKDEYMRSGDNLEGKAQFNMMNYFDVSQSDAVTSRRFEERFTDFSDSLDRMSAESGSPEIVWGILSTVEESEEELEKFYEDHIDTDDGLRRIRMFCIYPIVYNPAIHEKPGIAQFIIAEKW